MGSFMDCPLNTREPIEPKAADYRSFFTTSAEPVQAAFRSVGVALSHNNVMSVTIVVLLLALLAGAVSFRSFELDEGYSFLLLDGVPRLHWPAGLFTRPDIATWFRQDATLRAVPGNLRRFDVHPPVWFMLCWCWRQAWGSSLVAARCLSVALTLVNLLVFWQIARLCRVPAALASALAFLCYGMVYTGATVRMYPLGLLFLLCGVLALLHLLQTTGARGVALAAIAGLCFGLGAATHMLVLFPGVMMAAAAAVVLLRDRRFAALAALAAAPLPCIAWSASYFLVQDRRTWQFPPFRPLPMLRRVLQDAAGSILGGTPLCFDGAARLAVGAGLALLVTAALVLAVAVVIRRWRDPRTWILALGAVAMPCVLYGLGAVFQRQASEPRYMLYSIPFLSLLLAQGFRQTLLPAPAVAALLVALLGGELAGTIGLLASPDLQQPARRAMAEIAHHWQPGAIVLLPEAADTSGMTVDYAYEAPPDWPMALLRQDATPAQVQPLLRDRHTIFMVVLADDTGRAAIRNARRILAADGWYDAGAPDAHVSRQGQVWTMFRRGRAEIAQAGAGQSGSGN